VVRGILGSVPSVREGIIWDGRADQVLTSSGRSRVLVIVVLYKNSITRSSTCISINAQKAYDRDAISILVYDNSPVGNSEGLRSGWKYVSDTANRGLAAAYNYALLQTKFSGAQWLLLFDQDSSLPVDFFANLQDEIALCRDDPRIVAIVPVVFSNRRQVSPIRPMLGLDRPYKITGSASSLWLMAINSGAAIRVSFVDSIGGFSKEFWLDYLDHWLFRKIHDMAYAVYVSNTKIEHSLSVADFNQDLAISRYRNILNAEANFTNQYLPIYWRPLLVLRLLIRAAKHSIFTDNKRMALLMLSAAWKQVIFVKSRLLNECL